jgi:protein-disulfide isomerase
LAKGALLTALVSVIVFAAIPSSSLAQSAPPVSKSPVATVAGQPITEDELWETLGPQQSMQLRNQEYEVKSKALESLIRLRVVQAEAKKRGITPEKLVEQEVDSRVPEPSDREVEAYFLGQGNANARFDDVKEQLRKNLKTLMTQKARQRYADSLRAKTDVVVFLRQPTVDVGYDPARVRGGPQAPVTIVEFSDFQCPYCKQSESTLKDLLTKYSGQVKLAWRDFPLRDIHPLAQTAAEAARCAGEQGKFWEFHDALFADQSKLKEADLVASAKAIGLNDKSFRSCLASGKFKSKIEADLEDGRKVGVVGTPGFFINGVFLSGAQPQAEFERIIDGQLAASGAHSRATNMATK